MSVRIGDTVFIRNGMPVNVKARDELSGKLTLETDPDVVKAVTRHGYLNGMAPDTRENLYNLLDQIKGETTDPAQRVELMRQKLEELEQDPHNLSLSRYLKAEMTHIMNTFNIRPREFSVDESKIR